MNKIVHDLKVEIESIKKNPNLGNLKMKILGTQTCISEANHTTRIQKVEKRIADIEVTTEETNI